MAGLQAQVTADVLYGEGKDPNVVNCHLHVDLPLAGHLKAVTAILTGYMYTCTEHYNVERGCYYCSGRAVTFLEIEKVIFDDSGQHCEPGKYSWPFSFELPEKTALKEEDARQIGSRSYLALRDQKGGALKQIALPPTWWRQRKPIQKGPHARCCHGNISYRVSVKAPRESFFGRLEAHVHINYKPTTTRILAEPAPQDANVFVCQDSVTMYREDSVYQPRHPKPILVDLEVYVRFPSQIQLGNPQPFPFAIVVRTPKVKSFVLPLMTIEAMEIRLRTLTEWHDGESGVQYDLIRTGQENVRHPLKFEVKDGSDVHRAVIDWASLISLNVPDRRGQRMWPPTSLSNPTFETWIIKGGYTLVFRFKIVWEGGSHLVQSSNALPGSKLDIMVLPRHKAIREATDTMSVWNEPPPSYDDAVIGGRRF